MTRKYRKRGWSMKDRHKSGSYSHRRKLKRQIVSSTVSEYRNLAGRALTFFHPWTVWEYPGRMPGAMALVNGKVTLPALKHWVHDRRKFPRWAAELILIHHERKLAELEGICHELRQWIANPDSANGREKNRVPRRKKELPSVFL